MADEKLKRVAHVLRMTGGRSDRSSESDLELLASFRNSGDELAFEALVRRHGKAVLAACRQVLADAADIDDAFQATFLLLVKKVKTVDGATLGGWLFGVAHRLAVRAKADARRRAERETTVATRARMEAPPPDLLWREAVEILHEELDRMPDRYRRVLLLCYLDGQSRDEAAASLGWEAGAVKGCLERGRKLLGGRLAKRGVTLSAGLLAVLTGSARAAGGPRPGVIEAAVRAAAGAISPRVAALAAGGIHMGLSLKNILPALVLTAAVGLGAWGLWPGTPAPAASETPPGARNSADARRDAPLPATPDAASGSRVFAGQVLDSKGLPVGGAKVWVAPRNGRETGFDPIAAPEPTGPDGRFRFSVARDKTLGRSFGSEIPLVLVAAAPGGSPGWGEAREGVTIRLAGGDVKVTARVTTLEGQPAGRART